VLFRESGMRTSIKIALRDVAARHNIGINDILFPSRFNHLVAARHEFYYTVLMRAPKLSMFRLAESIGRDHTSVSYGLTKYAMAFGLPMPPQHRGGGQKARTRKFKGRLPYKPYVENSGSVGIGQPKGL
jgi:hypothetical protein